MTYTKPNLFELGMAQNLVLGDNAGIYLEVEGQQAPTNSQPVVHGDCGDLYETTFGCSE